MILGLPFYERPVLQVARDCIGKILVRRTSDGEVRGRIVEAEAYRGPEDRAAHSWGGRRTARTEVMFGRAGHAYVFFVYGMHWNFNLVTGAAGEPQAVLIRALEPLSGIELMAARRKLAPERVELTNGPGKLCQALAISRADYGVDMCSSKALFLLDAPAARVVRSPRIGVDYAGSWAARPWRFYEADNRFVTRMRAGPRAARASAGTGKALVKSARRS
ncbi:MAG TPA: DNA-3-methyladenine glycosylase [Polyangiaceae bacterium]|nr:DNA-3-methyladenine glycosylase [Polyangiaceae bacterium]